MDGACWRCGTEVVTRDLEQWFFRITAYADELLQGLDALEAWPERVVLMQRNWIGRSEGARLKFPIAGAERRGRGLHDPHRHDLRRDVRAAGARARAGGPLRGESADPAAFRERVGKFRALDRQARLTGEIEKEGFDTGRKAINPFTGREVPIWIANFVLVEYGTGAIMAVPAHDQRDFEFAKKYKLPITYVVQLGDGVPGAERCAKASPAYGRLVNSGEYTGQESPAVKDRMIRDAEAHGIGKGEVQFRLKDWGISRQRYWGTPIPVIHCAKDGVVGVPYEQLPVVLPKVQTFTGRGDSPLAQVPEFVNVTCPKCGGPARRETDTMDTFVDSSWYFLRFCDPGNTELPFSTRATPRTGCRWTSTSAASSTRFCTCSTRASSCGCCAISAWRTTTSRSRAC